MNKCILYTGPFPQISQREEPSAYTSSDTAHMPCIHRCYSLGRSCLPNGRHPPYIQRVRTSCYFLSYHYGSRVNYELSYFFERIFVSVSSFTVL